jgi:hypothetical protein
MKTQLHPCLLLLSQWGISCSALTVLPKYSSITRSPASGGAAFEANATLQT